MFVFFWLLAALAFGPVLQVAAGSTCQAPPGTAIVNSATNLEGSLAPNTIATIYGSGLAYTTKAISSDDTRAGNMPTVLPGTGVRVLVGSLAANIYYVSPKQINFLIPSVLIPGPVDVEVTLDGRATSCLRIMLSEAAPALFQMDPKSVIATRIDGSLVTKDSPAKGGEDVVLYATGLGQTFPPLVYGRVPTSAARLVKMSELRIVLNGSAIDAARIAYAGVAPGFAGLYQINLKLPDVLEENPETQTGFAQQLSPTGLRMFVRLE